MTLFCTGIMKYHNVVVFLIPFAALDKISYIKNTVD